MNPLSLWERVRVRGNRLINTPSPQPSPRGRGSSRTGSYLGRLGLAGLFAWMLASASVQAQEAAPESSDAQATASDQRGRGLADAALGGPAAPVAMTNLKHIVHQIQGANESMEMI